MSRMTHVEFTFSHWEELLYKRKFHGRSFTDVYIGIAMGPHYLRTFAYQYLAASCSHSKRVNLHKQSIIIDANSFMYFIYDKMLNDDKTKVQNQRLTNNTFGYDGYWRLLHDMFGEFKTKCSDVLVVFDGVFKRNVRRRPDPERTSSFRFADFIATQHQLPLLFGQGLIDTLKNLDIGVVFARGEADPMIVQLAYERDAYVIAEDTDYLLYNLEHGYVPLHFLNLQNLKGPLYQSNDIFQGMDAAGVALWTVIVKYDFVKMLELTVRIPCLLNENDSLKDDFFQEILSKMHYDDQDDFEHWLKDTDPDEPKRQLITMQWSLLRFIQRFGSAAAYQRLIRLVSPDDREQFDHIRSSYIDIKPLEAIKLENHTSIPTFLDTLFITGHLDQAIINILICRYVLKREKATKPVYYRLLLPIIQILLRWRCEQTGMTSESCQVTYGNQKYTPLAEIQEADLPSLDNIPTMARGDRKKWVLRCVKFALQSPIDVNVDDIHKDHLAWLCILKLWWHEGNEQTPAKKCILWAMIVSHIMHVLPDQQHASERIGQTSEAQSTSAPFLKYSKDKLMKRLSSKAWNSLHRAIKGYTRCDLLDGDEKIKIDMLEVEQFCHVFSMANQTFGAPIGMPKPRECISTLTYHLAIAFARSTKSEAQIQTSLFQHDQILVGLFGEMQEWIKQVHQPSPSIHDAVPA